MGRSSNEYLQAIRTFEQARVEDQCATVLFLMDNIWQNERALGWKKLRMVANDITLVENHFLEKYGYQGDASSRREDSERLKPLVDAATLLGAREHLSVAGMHRTLIRRIGMFYLDHVDISSKDIDQLTAEDRARRISSLVMHDLYKYSLDEFLGYTLKWGGVDWSKFADNSELQDAVKSNWEKSLAHHYQSYAHHPENRHYLALDDNTWEKMCDNVAVHIQKSLLVYTDSGNGRKTQVPVSIGDITKIEEFFWPKDPASKEKYREYLDTLKEILPKCEKEITSDIGLVVKS